MLDRLCRPGSIAAGVLLALVTGCAGSGSAAAPLRHWSYNPGMVFPADLSLARAEDGIALANGNLIVADQVHGLRLLQPNGRSQPFGEMPGAGYVHEPPRRHGAPNGVSLEPGGTHVLVSDVIGGEIYRVDIESGAAQLVFRHPYGVNAAVRDSSGAIWFSQSAHNTEEQGELGMFTPVDLPLAEGALWRLPFSDGQFAVEAELVVDGLHYANGLAIDEERGRLYLCELTADRVLSFPLEVSTGELGERSTLLEAMTPDNLELDADGQLWVALPGRNEILVVDPDTGAAHSVFHQQSPAQVELAEEFVRRGEAATPRLELLTPALYDPLPGFVTGVILGATDGAVYVTGLGDGLLRLDPAAAE